MRPAVSSAARRPAATLALALMLVFAGAAPVGVLAQDDGRETPTANGTAVQHRDPARVDEAGDLRGTQRWLADRLARRLGQSSVELSQGNYRRARRLAGADTRRLLAKYVDVAGETGATDDVDAFRETRATQRSFVNATREYRETYRAYRDARRAGDEARARRLAHRLERLSGTVSTNGSRLADDYRRVGNATGADMEASSDAVAGVVRNVTERQAEVRAATFTRTRLALRVASPAASFRSPLRVTGRLRTENGTPVANRTITLVVGRTRVETRTDAAGNLTVAYRPVSLPLATAELPVRYVPRTASPYLGSNATVPIDVTQVRPRVTVDANRSAVGYGEGLAVDGRVAVADIGAPGVPLTVAVGETTVGTTRTNADGTFSDAVALPAGVRPGARNVTVAVAMRDRALAAAEGTGTVRVRETPTALTTSATGGDTLRVEGALRTGDGRAVSGRTVRVRVDGEPAASVRTNADGTYAARVPAGDIDGAGRVPVTAAFDGRGTNLEPSRATTNATIPAGGSTGGDGSLVERLERLTDPVVIAGLVGLLALVGGLLAWYRRTGASADDGTGAAGDPAPDADGTAGAGEPALLDRAEALLSAGEVGAAVRVGYAGVRDRLGGSRALTHWEFYRSVDDRLPEDRRAALRTLIETYERAAFAGGVDEGEAERAVDAAKEVAGTRSDGGRDGET